MENNRKSSRPEVEHYDLEILLRRPSLRSGLPRRISSQARRETVQTEETTCGFGCIRNEWLQSFANRTTFLFVYGILRSFYGACHAYFYGIITTLEKRFGLSSQTTGTIVIVSEFVQIILCVVLSSCAKKMHKARWVGVGMYLVIISAFLIALPHFLFGSGEVESDEKFENSTFAGEYKLKFCSKHSESATYKDTEKNMPIILLILAQILHGIGGSLYIVMGKSYKNDNIESYQTPGLISFLSILKILGPAFGYWLSSISLKIFVAPSRIPFSQENDPHWIGAWWLGNLIIGFLMLAPASFIILFPPVLPKTAVRRIFGERMMKSEDRREKKDKAGACKSLSLIPIFNCYNFAGIASVLGSLAYFTFLPKYIETQYQLLPSEANLIIGTCTSIFSALGILTAISVITKYKITARALAGWNAIVGLLSIGGLISFIHLGCNQNDAQLKQMLSQLSINEQNNTFPFAPVCIDFVETFISPCHADCKTFFYQNGTKVYNNCIVNNSNKKAYSGTCAVDCHLKFLIFMIVTCSMTFLYATGRCSNVWFEMKFKEIQQKPKILFLGMALLTVFVFLPFHVLFGYILDHSCLLWDNNYTKSGNCWVYNNPKVRYNMNLAAVGLVSIGVVLDLGVWYFIKDIRLFDDDFYFAKYIEN